jgi:hypothetical protein
MVCASTQYRVFRAFPSMLINTRVLGHAGISLCATLGSAKEFAKQPHNPKLVNPNNICDQTTILGLSQTGM